MSNQKNFKDCRIFNTFDPLLVGLIFAQLLVKYIQNEHFVRCYKLANFDTGKLNQILFSYSGCAHLMFIILGKRIVDFIHVIKSSDNEMP